MASNGKEARKAFLSAFARGLSGAALLYATPALPAPARTTIQPIRQAFENASDAIRSDWAAVGSDLDFSMKKYAEAQYGHPSAAGPVSTTVNATTANTH